MVLYHVCRDGWDGGDLLALADRMEWGDEACEYIAANWPDCEGKEWEYYNTDGTEIHFHATLEQAIEFADEFGGEILVIDASGLDVREGTEYPHPVIRGRVTADRIQVYVEA